MPGITRDILGAKILSHIGKRIHINVSMKVIKQNKHRTNTTYVIKVEDTQLTLMKNINRE